MSAERPGVGPAPLALIRPHMPNAHSSPDRKYSRSVLSGLESALTRVLLSHVPPFVQSYHLTWATLIWSGLAIVASALARTDRRWLWALSAVILLQYLTDALDGKLGRVRGDGLVGWGYYMDHFLDYVFLCSLLIGYGLLLPAPYQPLMMVSIAVAGGFMVSTFLARTVTGVLRISYGGIGPIELRVLFVALNCWIASAGQVHMLAILPYALLVSIAVLGALAFQTQRQLWSLDRERLAESGATDRDSQDVAVTATSPVDLGRRPRTSIRTAASRRSASARS